MDNTVYIVCAMETARAPFSVISAAVAASQPGEDVTISVGFGYVPEGQPRLRRDPHPDGGGTWWLYD